MARKRRYFRYRRSSLSRLRSGVAHKKYMKDRGLLRCEVCGFFDPTVMPWYLIESHHIKRVADGGSHGNDNRLLTCPNHHALADHLSRIHKEIISTAVNPKYVILSLIKEHEYNAFNRRR